MELVQKQDLFFGLGIGGEGTEGQNQRNHLAAFVDLVLFRDGRCLFLRLARRGGGRLLALEATAARLVCITRKRSHQWSTSPPLVPSLVRAVKMDGRFTRWM